MLRIAACAALGIPQAPFCLRLWSCGCFPHPKHPRNTEIHQAASTPQLYYSDKTNIVKYQENLSANLPKISKGRLTGAPLVLRTLSCRKVSTRTCQSHFASRPCLWQEQHSLLCFLPVLQAGSVLQGAAKEWGQLQLLLQDGWAQSAATPPMQPPWNREVTPSKLPADICLSHLKCHSHISTTPHCLLEAALWLAQSQESACPAQD